MPTEAAKRGYVQSRVGGHALTQLKPKLRPNSTNPFVSADEMFEVLTAAFGNTNQKQEDRAAYRSLNQGTVCVCRFTKVRFCDHFFLVLSKTCDKIFTY